MGCELCGYDKTTVAHHKDRNPQNNSPENLQVLCWNCHFLQHHPEGCDGHKKREVLIASKTISHERLIFKTDIELRAITLAENEGIVSSYTLASSAGISTSRALRVLKMLAKDEMLILLPKLSPKTKFYRLPDELRGGR